MSEIKLTSFNPEAVAPNFTAHLKEKGALTFSEPTSPRYNPSIKLAEAQTALEVDVLIDGERIGSLAIGLSPDTINYIGRMPGGMAQYKGKLRRGQGVSDGCVLVYDKTHPFAKENGRTDGWVNIPFP